MESFNLHHLIIITLFLTFFPQSFSNLDSDRSALLRLQSALRGRTLLWNTTSNTTPCLWNGVICNNTINRVTELRLPGRSLVGQIPVNSIGNLTELRSLSLRENSISGRIPSDLGLCTHLQEIHLQGNNFEGEIPETFFSLGNLLRVNLGRNNFSGPISPGFNNLTRLRILNLENNSFRGSLPDLSRLTELRHFNISFNNELTGSVPSGIDHFNSSSFLGTSLCGGRLASCPNNEGDQLSIGAIAGIAVGTMVLFLIILVILLLSWRKYKSKRNPTQVSRSPRPPPPIKPAEHGIWISNSKNSSTSGNFQSDENLGISVGKKDGLVCFDGELGFGMNELLRASAEVMGKGMVGSTYKAYMDNGIEVIVKRLKNVCVSENEFRDKMEEIGMLRHDNLGCVRGYFYGVEEKLLVFDTISGGSLSTLLHGDSKQRVSFEIRSKIALGTARGIEYLHSISPTTTHGNIKSSNIFIKDYYEALVSEFGLTQLVSSLYDMNGYRAPEVTTTRDTSQMADVYSFGVIVLELLTRKEPTRALMEDGIELPKWVQSVVQDKWTIEVFDPDLLRYENLEEKMVQLLNLGVACTATNPDKRPSMIEVTLRVEEIIG